MSNFLIAIIVIIIVIALYVIVTYNSFIKLKNRVKEAWSDIEVQMKRRYDLIPNLVETVKGYATHESSTLEKVIQARNMAMRANTAGGNIDKIARNENILSGALKSLFALQENYPDLKANTNFLKLQEELTDTEDKMQAARRFYNGNVMTFNTKTEQFPSNIIAGLFSFKAFNFFKLDEADEMAKQAVKVQF